MKIMIKDGNTGDYCVIESDGIIEFELIPETEEEKEENTFWGLRMHVKGFIKELKKSAKMEKA